MTIQNRRNDGKFASKSDQFRQVRSIRLTDKVWESLGNIAEKRCITRADLIEEFVEQGKFDSLSQPSNQESLTIIEQQTSVIDSLTEQVDQLREENELLTEQRLIDLESLKEGVLFTINREHGKQAVGYRAAKKALTLFIKRLVSSKS